MTFLFSGTDRSDVPQSSSVGATGATFATQIRALEFEVERLRLMNQAMWELLRERFGLQDHDLEQKAQEIDMRDGIPDQQMSKVPLKCPNCGRISASKHWKCLYCGLEFEKPVMG